MLSTQPTHLQGATTPTPATEIPGKILAIPSETTVEIPEIMLFGLRALSSTYLYIDIYTHTYICIYMQTHTYILRINTYAYIYIYVYIYIYIFQDFAADTPRRFSFTRFRLHVAAATPRRFSFTRFQAHHVHAYRYYMPEYTHRHNICTAVVLHIFSEDIVSSVGWRSCWPTRTSCS